MYIPDMDLVLEMSQPLTWMMKRQGFDINCGVRLIRTNLTKKGWYSSKSKVGIGTDSGKGAGIDAGTDTDDVNIRESLVQVLFEPNLVGVGQDGIFPITESDDVDDILTRGVDWAIENG